MASIGSVIELKAGKVPTKRSEFGLCSFEHNIYIYGGYGKDKKRFDDLWHTNGI